MVVTARPRKGQQGYALIVLAVILGMGALYLIVGRLEGKRAEQARDEATMRVLAQAKDALIGYAMTYRDQHAGEMFGYLPCPDRYGRGTAEGTCGASGQSVIGLLPYRTLGLPDLRDETGTCLWYAVGGTFKNNPKTVRPVNWDLQGQFQVNAPTGAIRLAPEDAEGGAVAVVIAAGPPLAGQNRAPPALTEDQRCNVADARAVFASYLESAPFPAGGVGAANAIITITEGESRSAANNDRVLWITPREIHTAIKTRGDFAAHITALAADIGNRYQGQAILPAPVAGAAAGPKASGTIPATVTAGYFPDSTTSNDYYPHWSGQFRYAVCANQKTRCLNGGACTGVLLFGGERAAGGPRTAVQASDVSSYLEGVNLASFTGAGTVFSGPSTFTVTNPRLAAAGDVMLCLNPPEVSFQRDLGDFRDVAVPLNIVGVSGAQSLVDRSTGALVLGNNDATTGRTDADTGHAIATGQLFGCSWYGNTVAFGNGARIYFRFRIENDTPGEGFTLTLADSAVGSNPTTNMCGSGGDRLGYAGTNSNAVGIPYTAPILYPKIGLEFDTQRNIASRNDSDNRHVAILYWGKAGLPELTDDDNVHHIPPPATVTESGVTTGFPGPVAPLLTSPLNTKRATLTCLNSSTTCPTAADRTFLVRVDITRAYTASATAGGQGAGAYNVKAWVVRGTSADDFAGIDNVAVDFSGTSSANYLQSGSLLLPPTVYLEDAVTLQDVRPAEALHDFWVGFTVGQSSAGQRYTVSDFKLKSR